MTASERKVEAVTYIISEYNRQKEMDWVNNYVSLETFMKLHLERIDEVLKKQQ